MHLSRGSLCLTLFLMLLRVTSAFVGSNFGHRTTQPLPGVALQSTAEGTETTPRPRFSPYLRDSAIYQKKSRRREKCYYEILGVSPKATKDEIKAKYVAMARETHPDALIGRTEPAQKDMPDFNEIATAWQTLSNRKKRLQYDRTIMADDFSDYVVDAGGLLVKFAFSFGSKAASAAKNAAKDVIYRARSKARKS